MIILIRFNHPGDSQHSIHWVYIVPNIPSFNYHITVTIVYQVFINIYITLRRFFMEKFRWTRFFIYLIVGFIILGIWGYTNYINYVQVEQATYAQIKLNNNLIDTAVEDIETKQMELRQVQRAYRDESLAMIVEPSRLPASPPIAASPYPIDSDSDSDNVPDTYDKCPNTPLNMVVREDGCPEPSSVTPVPVEPIVDKLQNRIDELEKEKQAYLSEKGHIAKEIEDVMTLFKIDAKNPFINIVLLPMFAYFFKKLIDFGFKRLEEKFYHET